MYELILFLYEIFFLFKFISCISLNLIKFLFLFS